MNVNARNRSYNGVTNHIVFFLSLVDSHGTADHLFSTLSLRFHKNTACLFLLVGLNFFERGSKI